MRERAPCRARSRRSGRAPRRASTRSSTARCRSRLRCQRRDGGRHSRWRPIRERRLLPPGEIRWQVVFLDEEATVRSRATDRARWRRPAATSARAYAADFVSRPTPGGHRTTATLGYWGLAVRLPGSAGSGSRPRSYSNLSNLHALGAWSAGLTFHPWNASAGAVFFALAFNARSTTRGAEGPHVRLRRGRPSPRVEALEIGLERALVDPRASRRGLLVPRWWSSTCAASIGRLRGDVAVLVQDVRSGRRRAGVRGDRRRLLAAARRRASCAARDHLR
jgi:hypothetical protein